MWYKFIFHLEREKERNYPELIKAFRDLAAAASQPQDSFLYEYLHERGVKRVYLLLSGLDGAFDALTTRFGGELQSEGPSQADLSTLWREVHVHAEAKSQSPK
jgi:hypothetical protein